MNSRLVCLMIATALVQQGMVADTLRLKDGSAIQGTMIDGDTQALTFVASDGVPRKYQIGQISAVEFKPMAPPPSAPAASQAAAPKVTVPTGTQITVRMMTALMERPAAQASAIAPALTIQ